MEGLRMLERNPSAMTEAPRKKRKMSLLDS